MNSKDLKVGLRVSFTNTNTPHTGVVASIDGKGNATLSHVTPPIVGAPTLTRTAGDLTAIGSGKVSDVKPGAHVSFADAAGTHTGIVASIDGHGDAVVGQLNPAIAGSPTVTKPVADLAAAK